MISVSKKANDKIKEISDAEGIGHTSVRVRVFGGGCAGFSYDMSYDDKPSDLDESFVFDGITIIIDPLSVQYLDGVEIDWAKEGLGEGFKFINPNVKSTCGCGSSFSV